MNTQVEILYTLDGSLTRKVLDPKPVIKAPNKYGNKYFNAMECPLDLLPETFIVHYRNGNGSVAAQELPTSECVVKGSMVARRYTGLDCRLVDIALNKRGVFHTSTIWGDTDGFTIEG